MYYWGVKVTRVIITIFVVTTLNFIIPRCMPGDPVVAMFGQEAVMVGGQDLQAVTARLGLDQPLLTQYSGYWRCLADGDLGYSFHYHQAVSTVIGQHLIWTIIMLVPSVILSSVLALLSGLLAGWHAGSKLDMAVVIGALGLYGLPQFLVAMLALNLLGFKWRLFPLGGLYSGQAFLPADIVWHLALPVTVLTITATAAKFLVMRNSVVQIKNADYVLYARAKGLSPKRILGVHVMKNACLPLISMIALNMGFVVTGALVVEVVFSIDGMGTLLYDAVGHRDYPMLQGCFLVLTLFVVGANAAAETVYGLLDPRIAGRGGNP